MGKLAKPSTTRWGSIFDAFGFGSRRSRKGIKPQRRRTFSIEPLEERQLLSVCHWTGGGNNDYWSNSANWDQAPQAGDDLVFQGTAQTTTQNDFTAGTSFHSIEFAASNFSLTGNAVTLTGGITVDTGVSGSAVSLNAALSGSITASVASSETLAISGILSGSGSLSTAGSGTLTLSGVNTYTGGTTISGGTLAFGPGALDYSSEIDFDGGGLQWGSGNTEDVSGLFGPIDSGETAILDTNGNNVTLATAITGDGGLEKTGAGTLTLSGTNTYTGGTTISAGTLQLGDGTTDGSVTGDITDNAALVFDNTADLPYDGAIDGTGSLTKTGAGTLRLTGELSYIGGTTVDQGTLLICKAVPAYVEPGGVGSTEVSAAFVRYGDGDVLLTADDLGTGTMRSYSAQAAADLGAGYGWQLTDMPYITWTADQTVVTFSPQKAYWFTLSGSTYTAQFGASQTLTHDAANHLYKFTDTDGTVYEFDDYSYTDSQAGQFRKSVAPNGDTTEVTSWTSDGKIAEIQYTLGGASVPYESHQFTYYGTSDPNAGRLYTVTVQRNSSDPVSWTNVQQVTYTYYDGLSDTANGSLGDLKTAVCQSWEPDSSTWVGDDTYYYRYYTEGNLIHCLKMAFDPQEYQNVENPTASGGLGVSDPTVLTDAQLLPYSSEYYEYDSSRQVTSATIGGTCTYTYAYTASSLSDGYNNWDQKTIETRPDGSTYTVYTNYLGEIILTDLADTSSNHLYTYNEYGTSGYDDAQVILQAASSAVAGYTESGSLTVSLNASSGVLDQYVYYASTTATETTAGGVAGYLESESLLHGTGDSSPDVLDSYTYFAHEGTNDDLTITIYPAAQSTVYSEEGGAGAVTTDYAYTWYSGTLQVNEERTTLPAVSTAENGSGVAATTFAYYSAGGNLEWSADQNGRFTRYVYDNLTGQLLTTIEDANAGYDYYANYDNTGTVGTPLSLTGRSRKRAVPRLPTWRGAIPAHSTMA